MQIIDLRTTGDVSVIKRIYHNILEPVFDEAELETLEAVCDGLTDGGRYETLGVYATGSGGVLIGCALGYPYARSRVLLLGYLAVAEEARSRGVGSQLLDEVERKWFSGTRYNLLVVEIEDPRGVHTARCGADATRRISFYDRRGAKLLVGPYFQPKVRDDTGRVYEMFLTVLRDEHGSAAPSEWVAGSQIVAFLEEYFAASAEAEDALSEGEGRALAEWYRSRDRVALHPLGDFLSVEIPRLPNQGVVNGPTGMYNEVDLLI